jgi:hypothetical protein
LNKIRNHAVPQTSLEDENQGHGEMTDERISEFKKVIQGTAIEKFGHCDPLDSPFWDVFRAR